MIDEEVEAFRSEAAAARRISMMETTAERMETTESLNHWEALGRTGRTGLPTQGENSELNVGNGLFFIHLASIKVRGGWGGG